MIRDLATDQSLRGLTSGVDNALMAVRSKYLTLDDLAAPSTWSSDTLDKIVAGQPASFSWRVLAQRQAGRDERTAPLHRGAAGAGLQPRWSRATPRPRRSARRRPSSLREYQAPRPADRAGADGGRGVRHAARRARVLNGIVTLVVVLLILWLALRSKRHHPGGVHQSVRRLGAHGGARPDDGRRAQPDLGRLRGAVRRPRRRFRHPVRVRYRAERHEVDDLPAGAAQRRQETSARR